MKVWAGVTVFGLVCGVVGFMVHKNAGAEIGSVVGALAAVLALLAKSPLAKEE